jgi:hypothetical protein
MSQIKHLVHQIPSPQYVFHQLPAPKSWTKVVRAFKRENVLTGATENLPSYFILNPTWGGKARYVFRHGKPLDIHFQKSFLSFLNI